MLIDDDDDSVFDEAIAQLELLLQHQHQIQKPQQHQQQKQRQQQPNFNPLSMPHM